MTIRANDPQRKSWVEIPENSDFPIQNLPFGIFSDSEAPRVGVAIGDKVIDLEALSKLGYLDALKIDRAYFVSKRLNDLMLLGKEKLRELRNRISDLFEVNNVELQRNPAHVEHVLLDASSVKMHMPVKIGDYTDFYSSKEHATNVGTMFRDPENALLPNWLHIPVGYHGRASSIVLSGTPIHRPKGQQKPANSEAPIFGPTKFLDFELEMAFVTFEGKTLGDSISTAEAEDYIFGMVLFNDWSARDIQRWEYVPLGPFLAKNFASSISPWIVTLDALQPFKIEGPKQDPKPFEYLQFEGAQNYDIQLEVAILPKDGEATVISQSNFKYMYWNMAQQLAHHTVNGCNIHCGDMMASGTISGPTPKSYGSMLEITWRGSKPVQLKDGSERKAINDDDTVIMRGHCEKNGVRIGFGEVFNKVMPAK